MTFLMKQLGATSLFIMLTLTATPLFAGDLDRFADSIEANVNCLSKSLRHDLQNEANSHVHGNREVRKTLEWLEDSAELYTDELYKASKWRSGFRGLQKRLVGSVKSIYLIIAYRKIEASERTSRCLADLNQLASGTP